MKALTTDADLGYVTGVAWAKTGSGGILTINVDTSKTEFSALSSGAFLALANATGGKLYWTYGGTLAKELGF